MAQNGARKALAIAALLAGRQEQHAATAAGVSRRTLSRWLTEPDFQAQLQAQADAMLQRARLRALAGATSALDALFNAMVGGPQALQIRAAGQWLSTALRLARDRDLEQRLSRLERALFERVDSQE